VLMTECTINDKPEKKESSPAGAGMYDDMM